MKKTITIMSLCSAFLLIACSTPNAVKHDSKVAWEGTKKTSGEVWEGTKKASNDAWSGTKKVINNATSD